jgi:hypothetical protein
VNRDLITKYEEAAIAHGNGTTSGDSNKTNKAYNTLNVTLREITSLGEDENLFTLYNNKNPWARLWAATHTLEVDEKRAIKKLQYISDEGIPIASISARYTLQEWEQGDLTFR